MHRGPFGRFEECYQALSAESLPADTPHREALVHGNKLVLPASALDRLSRLHVSYPLMFALAPYAGGGRKTHAGVLEFSAPEGVAYVAPAVLQALGVAPGGLLRVSSATLPRASFVKLQPLDAAFAAEITDARAVLERALRSYAALTVGDLVSFAYNGGVYCLRVLETRAGGMSADVPGAGGMCILETDLQVDFAPAADAGTGAPSDGGRPAAAGAASAASTAGTLAQAADPPRIVAVPRGGVVFAPVAPGAAPPAKDETGEQQPAFKPFSGRANRLV